MSAIDEIGYNMAEKEFFVNKEGGYISVELTPDFPNPLNEWEPFAAYLTWERNASSPSANHYRSPEEFFETFFDDPETGLTMEEMAAAIAEADGGICEPVFRSADDSLGFSNMSFATTPPWCVGFAFASAETLASEGVSREHAVELMKDDLSRYSAWVVGDVWSVVEYAEDGVEKDGVSFYGLDDLEAAYPNLEPASPIVSAALKGVPFVDSRGMVVLESFDRKDGLSDVLAFAPDKKEYVVARAYDEETGECAQEERFADPMHAWAAANTEVIEKSLVVWEKDDVRASLKDHGLDPSEHAVDDVIRSTSSLSGWRDFAVENGNEELSEAAWAAAASRIASRVKPRGATVPLPDLTGERPSKRNIKSDVDR